MNEEKNIQNTTSLLVEDIHRSIQGQGFYIGEISTILELAEIGEMNDVEEIGVESLSYELVENCHDMGTDIIIIKGGEPFSQNKGLMELIELLPQRLKITIETHGGLPIPTELYDSNSVFLSIEPKIQSDTYDDKYFDENTLNINKEEFWNYQVKFTIEDIEEDIEEAEKLLRRSMIPEFPCIVFQPATDENDSAEELINKTKELTDYIIQNKKLSKFDIRVLPKLDKIINRM